MLSYTRAAGESNRKGGPQRWQGARHAGGYRGHLVALAGAGLWIGLNASLFNPISLTSSDLRIGAWLTIGGALVGFIAAFFLRRRVI